MPNVEIKSTSVLTRAEVGRRLVSLGNALQDGGTVEVDWGQETVKVGVPDRVDWELEIEVDGDETEIEIEISWKDSADAEAPGGDAAATSANPRRTRASRAKPG